MRNDWNYWAMKKSEDDSGFLMPVIFFDLGNSQARST